MQVKVKNSRELRRYVSQNIQSSCWNSTVNNYLVFWPNLYSARICCIYMYLSLIDKLL